MSEDFESEIKKFEARIERLLDKENEFSQALRRFADELKAVGAELSKMKARGIWDERKAAELRFRIIRAFNDAFSKQSELEHEKSHLIESYGRLLLALEVVLKKE